LEYLTGAKIASYYKWVWVALIFVGATVPLSFVWNISDAFNGLMAVPNLIALMALSSVVFGMLREYENKLKK
jgi:AGCS family alanine or glycine:cation symporter